MAVIAAVAGAGENFLRQQQPVGDDDRHVRTEIPKGLAVRGILEIGGRQHRYAQPLGSLMHGGLLQVEAAPAARPRRLRVNGGDLVTRPGERQERRHGKFRCAHEDHAKRQVAASVSFDCP